MIAAASPSAFSSIACAAIKRASIIKSLMIVGALAIFLQPARADWLDLLSQSGAVGAVTVPAPVVARGDPQTLAGGASGAAVELTIPASESAAPTPFLRVTLSRPQAVGEVAITIDRAHSDPAYTRILRSARIEAGPGVAFTTPAGELDTDDEFPAISYQIRADGALRNPEVSELTFLVDTPRQHPLHLTLTGVSLYAAPTPKLLNPGAGGRIVDVHFHPCSFSNYCSSIPEIIGELERYGVSAAFIYGLEHNLVEGDSPAGKAARSDYDTSRIRKPFHYNDPGAAPSYFTSAKPGVASVNRALESSHKAPIAAYEGWPVYPTTLADWRTLSDYRKLDPADRKRVYPFLSSLRLVHAEEAPHLKIGVCTRNPETGNSWNLDLAMAMDTLFPGQIFGYAEYNLNKVVLFAHDSYSPDIDDQWIECMRPVMAYLAATGRAIGFHLDIAEDEAGRPAYDKLMRVAKAFPDTRIIWDHGGIAPEAPPTLSTKRHLQLLEAFLATSPGKRLIDLSWPNGFFLRLNPDRLGAVEADPETGAERARDWAADLAAYIGFIETHADRLMLGSDQVAVNYPPFASGWPDGTPFLNHAGYYDGQTYGAGLRMELGLLAEAQRKSGVKLSAEAVDKVAAGTAETLLRAIAFPAPPSDDAARNRAHALIRRLIEIQYEETVGYSGPTAPPPDQFIPPELRPKPRTPQADADAGRGDPR